MHSFVSSFASLIQVLTHIVRTSFVIPSFSSRLSTVRNADRIIVLSAGKLVEEGTHDQLMAINGAYSALVKTQVRVPLVIWMADCS